MKSVHSMIATLALALALILPAAANASQADPEVIIYRASGASDNGGNTATSITCTPFSGANESIRVVVRDGTGSIKANVLAGVSHLATAVFSTSDTLLFGDVNLTTGTFGQDTIAIAATSTSVTCTAMLIQPNNTAPVGVHLHLIRFSPLAGTAE
jgi:hypothetical protein